MMPLRIIATVLACVLVGFWTFAISGRLLYPFELEWMEGASAVHVTRLLEGRGIYVRPTLDFVPFGYPALYYYACLPVAWIVGSGLTALRIVSIVATSVTLAAAYAIVRRRSGAAAGLVAAGVFAGAYALSDGWYDLGRVDALYVSLLSCVYLSAIRAERASGWVLCGALAAAAFATKQPAILAIAPLALYLLVTNRSNALIFGGTFAVLSALAFLVLNETSDGWYRYYVVDVPRWRMAVSPRGRGLSFWTMDLLPVLPAVIAGAAVVVMLREWRHAAMATGLIGAAWLARLEGGAWNNAVMPAYLAAAVLLGLSLRPDLSGLSWRWSLAAAQLAVLLYDPRPFIPTSADVAKGKTFVNQLSVMERPVLVMNNGSWATAAGLPEHAHGWAVTDVVWADQGEAGRALERDIQMAIRGRYFATIIEDGQQSWFRQDLETHYRPVREVDSPPLPSGAPRQPAVALGRK